MYLLQVKGIDRLIIWINRYYQLQYLKINFLKILTELIKYLFKYSEF